MLVGTMEYGRGYKQRKIMELGKKNQLTFGDMINLFGPAQSLNELEKLVELGLVVIDEDTMEDNELSSQTKLRWLEPEPEP